MPVILHHLELSRSERIIWLLEELNAPYEIKRYKRDPQVRLAPPELAEKHRLGKAPLLSLGLRLGEGSGAALSIGVLKGAVACHSGMATFAEAGVNGA